MKKRKLIALILGMVLVIGALAGCGAKSSDTATTSEETTAASKAGNGKTLVVYFSAQGHTETVAKTIAEEAGADTFVITPVDEYAEEDLDWNSDDSRVTKEHNDESLRDVKLKTTDVDNWDSYETVYIGYPIWWGDAAWPVNNFIKNNDFTGKTVIPFCTSASSDIGDSGKNLAKMAGTGDWQDGNRFEQGASADDIKEWVKSLQ